MMRLPFTGKQRLLRRFGTVVQAINARRYVYEAMTDAELRACTDKLRMRVREGQLLDEILIDSFALVREVSGRSRRMYHYDVQLVGAIALHHGMIAEMATGEGKTLVATCPAFLNALTGSGVHIVTVNDYLARRDAEWMGPIYRRLGLTVGYVRSDTDSKDRQQCYAPDITYGTSREFVNDYLYDNLKLSTEDQVQRGLNYCIIDDIDCALIDNARTMNQITEPIFSEDDKLIQADRIARMLKVGEHFETSDGIHLTDQGIDRAQTLLGVDSLVAPTNLEWFHLLLQALKAHILYRVDQDYIIKKDRIIRVDPVTGFPTEGIVWGDGLHQAIELKENLKITTPGRPLASISTQNFFRLYKRLSGMTGTAETVSREFRNVYNLDVLVIPPNRKLIREDAQDVIYKTAEEKYFAIVEDITCIHEEGRPILVGTTSIEKTDLLSNLLQRRGIPHEVLNAKNHELEALIIMNAGQRGAVTIAANMAGRGVDIELGEGVKEIGGLHVIGTERHEDRRIDDQLRGRAGRQGDPGSSQFFLSFDDDLMRVFAPEWTVKALSWIGWKEGQPITHRRISRGIERAQRKVEERNFYIRKSLLEYDEVLDYQRKAFYERRRRILNGVDLNELVQKMIDSTIENSCNTMFSDSFPYNSIAQWASINFGVKLKSGDLPGLNAGELEKLIKDQAKDNAASNISLSISKYIEDYGNPNTWDVTSLYKWAMSSFHVSLSPDNVERQSPEDIGKQLIMVSAEQVDKKDCSPLVMFLKDDFAIRAFSEWARAKFEITLDIADLKNLKKNQIRELATKRVIEKYKRREIEYPVEFAMRMVYGLHGTNVYAFESLATWVNRRYGLKFTAEELQNTQPNTLQEQLLELSTSYNSGKLEQEIDDKLRLDAPALADWARTRFDADLDIEQLELADRTQRREVVLQAARRFLRCELSHLEKYVLLQVYDAAWKSHLGAMDNLKDYLSVYPVIEGNPKTEYQREGHRLFRGMLESVEDRVTDIVLMVHLENGASVRNVWNVNQTNRDEVA